MKFFLLLNSFHQTLGQFPFIVRLAILLRNQCDCVIRYWLSSNVIYPTKTGESWLIKTIAPKSSTFIDVGANVGNWTNLFMESMPKGGKGLLFDPSDCAIEKLKQRFDKVAGIEVIKAALSDGPGKAHFYEEPVAGESSSLVAGFSRADAIKKVVDVTTIDAEVENHRLEHIDFLKIDAEGYDLHVLRGASNLISRKKVSVIQFEYGSPWRTTGSTLAEAYKILESFGYNVFLLKENGLFDLKYSGQGEYFSYSNFVAVSPSRIKDLQPFISVFRIFAT